MPYTREGALGCGSGCGCGCSGAGSASTALVPTCPTDETAVVPSSGGMGWCFWAVVLGLLVLADRDAR